MKSKLQNKALTAALFTIFLDAVGIAILIPVYAALVLPGKYQIIPADWSVRDGYIMVGWLTGIYSLCTFLAAPVLGQLSDKYGRKRVLASSLLGTAFGYALFAIGVITKNIPLLFLSRMIDGITGGNIAVARAVVSDISTPKTRTKNFGLIGAMFGIGFVLGPYLGGRLSSPDTPFINIFGFQAFSTPSWFNPATPFWFATMLALINTLLVLFVLPETLKERIHTKLKFNQSFLNIKHGLKLEGIKTLLPVNFLFSAGFTFFTTFFGFTMIKRISGFTPANVADYFSLIGIWIAVFQVALIPFLSKRYKNYEVLRIAYFGAALVLPIVLLATTTTQAVLMSPLIPLFIAPIMANSIALLSSMADPHEQGEIMGVNSSFEALAQGIPAVLSGYVASIAVGLPSLVGSGLMVIAGLLFIRTFKPSFIKHAQIH